MAAGVTAAAVAFGASSPFSDIRPPQHGRLAPGGRGSRGGPEGHLQRAQGGTARRRFDGAAADSKSI